MKVGVLGSGDVAKVLAAGFLKHGHDVTIGTRTPAKLTDWAKQNPKGKTGSFADAAKASEAVVLAVKGTAEAARAIEPLCMLLCIRGFLHNEWRHAFKLLT